MWRRLQGNCHDEAWKTSAWVYLRGLEHRSPTYPRVKHPIPSPSLTSLRLPLLWLPLLLRLLHSTDPSLSATIGAKCLPHLHLAVIVRAGVVTDVAHQLRPVLCLEITYPPKTLQTLERIILLREQTIPLQRYESTHSPTRTRY